MDELLNDNVLTFPRRSLRRELGKQVRASLIKGHVIVAEGCGTVRLVTPRLGEYLKERRR